MGTRPSLWVCPAHGFRYSLVWHYGQRILLLWHRGVQFYRPLPSFIILSRRQTMRCCAVPCTVSGSDLVSHLGHPAGSQVEPLSPVSWSVESLVTHKKLSDQLQVLSPFIPLRHCNEFCKSIGHVVVSHGMHPDTDHCARTLPNSSSFSFHLAVLSCYREEIKRTRWLAGECKLQESRVMNWVSRRIIRGDYEKRFMQAITRQPG